jgi:hypothetical protein
MLTMSDKKQAARLLLALDASRAPLTEHIEASREAWDERSEKWQAGEKGQAALEQIEAMEEALDAICEQIDTLRDAIGPDVVEAVLMREH